MNRLTQRNFLRESGLKYMLNNFCTLNSGNFASVRFSFTETSCFGKNAVSAAIAPINPQNNTVSNISLFLAIISPLRNGNTGTDYSFDLPVTPYKAQSQPHKMQFPTRPYTFYPLISNTCSSISEVTPLPSQSKSANT